jgi:hypothetical protein
MSGGYIDPQAGAGDHQLVVFTFIGALAPDQRNKWNEAIANLKSEFGSHLVGVTVKGLTTSAEFLEKQKPKPPKK